MVPRNFQMLALALVGMTATAVPVFVGAPSTPLPTTLSWTTVVNNGDLIPGSAKNFNSYNQPSVNTAGWAGIYLTRVPIPPLLQD